MVRLSFSFRIFACCLLLALLPTGCRKLLEVPTPQDEISAGEVFSSDANALSALTGLYIQIMDNSRSLLNGGLSLYGGLSSDELRNTMKNASIDAFRSDSLTGSNPLCSNLYTAAYNLIYTANSLIAGLAGSSGVSTNKRTEMRGEAEFVRALIYFYLVNLYGPVPLVTTTNFAVSSVLPRAPVAVVYQQIVADLLDAQNVLSATYINAVGYEGNRTRPNRAAASALLARVCLYQGNWAFAEAEADSVIGNPLYQLEPSPDSVFLSTSTEAIWQLQPVHDSMATAEGSLFLPVGGRAAYALDSGLQHSWEPGDLRRVAWTDSVITGGVVTVYPYKYKLASNTPPNREYNMVLRLAEVYLIRAEARAQQGNAGGAAADLNIIRQRAGLAGTGAAGQPALLAAIGQERRVELFTEWGHRWLDLKRTGQADAVLDAEKSGWRGMDTLYPIPSQELQNNSHLVQNSGY